MAFTLAELLAKPEEEDKEVLPTPLTTNPVTPIQTVAPTKEEVVPQTEVKGFSLAELTDNPVENPLEPKPRTGTELTVEDIVKTPEELDKARRYMIATRDVSYETAAPEDVVQDYMAAMRFFQTNEAYTVTEAMDIYAADDAKKAVYKDAYELYDRVGNIYSNGDAWNGMIDYAQAFATSPSTYLGLGIGRIAGAAGSRAARAAAIQAATGAAGKEIAKKSGGKIAAEVAEGALKSEAAKVSARVALGGALTVEAGAAAISDYFYQDARLEVGAQDEYSVMQTGLSALFGGAGAIVPAGILLRSKNSTLAKTGELLDASYTLRASTAAKRAAPKIAESLKKAELNWKKLVEAGAGYKQNKALEKELSDWFFSVERPDSLFRILRDEGAELNLRGGTAAADLFAYAKALDDDALAEINKTLEPFRVSFGEMVELANKADFDAKSNLDLAMEIAGGRASAGGEALQPISAMVRFNKMFKNLSVAKQQAAKNIVEDIKNGVPDELDDLPVTGKDYVGYLSSTWSKLITATPMTTATNIKGWALVNFSEGAAQLIQASGLYGKAGVKAMIGRGNARDIARANAMIRNTQFNLGTYVDPFLSAEAFFKLLDKAAPAKTKSKISGQLFGGLEDLGPERFGLDVKSKTLRVTEGYANLAQSVSFTRLQDVLTKGVSGLQGIDRQARLNFGKGIEQLLTDGEAWKLTDDMWEKVYDKIAKETLSEDFSRGNFFLSSVARSVQSFSSDSYGRLLMPFGRFINSSMAYMYRYTPLGLLSVGRVWKQEGEEAVEEVIARSVAGSVFIGFAMSHEAAKQAKGLQWYQEELPDGRIENVQTLFPYSLYNLLGRIAHNAARGEGGNIDLVNELQNQFAAIDTMEQYASLRWLKPAIDVFINERQGEEGVGLILQGAQAATMAATGFAAGALRPLELPTRMTSYPRESFGGGLAIDRKQADSFSDKFALEASRYVSGFFNFAFGEENEYGTRTYGAPRESASSVGPVRESNPGLLFSGTKVEAPRTKINVLLGMVDKPPFKADSFTSGVPEFDALMNKEITPILEAKAGALLKNHSFKSLPQSAKIDKVNQLINEARNEILSSFESTPLGDGKERLTLERRNLLTEDISSRIRAKKALGITTEDHKLSLYEIESIRTYIKVEGERFKRIK